MPGVVLRDERGRVRGVNGEGHAMVREWVVQREQRVRVDGRMRMFGELPQAAPAWAGLLLEEDAIFPRNPGARFGELNGFASRFLARDHLHRPGEEGAAMPAD